MEMLHTANSTRLKYKTFLSLFFFNYGCSVHCDIPFFHPFALSRWCSPLMSPPLSSICPSHYRCVFDETFYRHRRWGNVFSCRHAEYLPLQRWSTRRRKKKKKSDAGLPLMILTFKRNEEETVGQSPRGVRLKVELVGSGARQGQHTHTHTHTHAHTHTHTHTAVWILSALSGGVRSGGNNNPNCEKWGGGTRITLIV